MPEDPNEPIRVLDEELDRKVTIRRASLPHGKYKELKSEDAVNPNTGDFLPPEFDVSKHSTPKKEIPNG